MAFHNLRDKNGKFARKDGKASTPKAPKVVTPAAPAPTPGLQAAVAPSQAPVVGRTFIAYVLDNSGSMSHLKDDVVRGYNAMVSALPGSFQGQHAYAACLTFATYSQVVKSLSLVQYVQPITLAEYWSSRDNGSTALFSSVLDAIEYLKSVSGLPQPGDAFLVVTFTDGDENTHRRVQECLQQCQRLEAQGNWTFTYQVPPRAGDVFARRWGVPRGNVREWEATAKGAEQAFSSTMDSMVYYANSRASGQTATASFYVTTDLSKVTQADLSKLTNLVGLFKSHTVDREVDVKEFIEKKTKHAYVVGQAYYQLMKKEKVQPQKNVLIREKTSGAIYGGPQARGLVGLPTGADAVVTPGNHSNYDIFVQSTSVNRKLPRGTTVLVDTTHLAPSAPTWSP